MIVKYFTIALGVSLSEGCAVHSLELACLDVTAKMEHILFIHEGVRINEGFAD